MTPIFDWYPRRSSWAEKARMFWDSMGDFANNAILILLFGAALFTVYAIGHAVGVKSADGCQLDHGQVSIAVLAYRDVQDKLHCQIRMNPYFRSG